MNNPVISVVIPAYNEEEYIREAIKSVKQQICSVPFEIVVVDNNSKDLTNTIAKEAGARVVVEKKQGQPFARARGAEEALGDVLVFIDSDSRLPQHWLQTAFSYLETHPGVSCISCRTSFYDGRIRDNIGSFLFNWIFAPLVNFSLLLLGQPQIVLGTGVVLRRKLLEQAGGIDTNYVFYGEDTGIAYTMAKMGKVRFLQNLVVLTSARRYKKQGTIKTLYLYWKIFFLIHMGRYKEAIAFSHANSRTS